MTKYYYAGSTRVAMRTGSTTDPIANLSYLLGDHLGSTSVTANNVGARVGELRYKPLGRTRYTYGTTPTTYRFTGQRAEASVGGSNGLYFYGSRYYDPLLGRFISPDSMIPDPSNPADYDRYSYVGNNPVNYSIHQVINHVSMKVLTEVVWALQTIFLLRTVSMPADLIIKKDGCRLRCELRGSKNFRFQWQSRTIFQEFYGKYFHQGR